MCILKLGICLTAVSGRMDASAAPGGARQLIDFEEKLWRTPASVSAWSVSPEARKSSGDARSTARIAARHATSPEDGEGALLFGRPVTGGDQSSREGSNVSVEPEASARFSNDMESIGSEWRRRGESVDRSRQAGSRLISLGLPHGF